MTGQSPVRVLIDLHMLSAGGYNGGVKEMAYRHLEYLLGLPGRFEIEVIAARVLAAELKTLSNRPVTCHLLFEEARYAEPATAWRYRLRGWRHRWGHDVIYTPTWYTPFGHPLCPKVITWVDALHLDHPGQLPQAEVAWRQRLLPVAKREATRIVVLSHAVAASFSARLNVPSTQLAIVPPFCQMATARSDGAKEPRYFFYPANLWRHKNHRMLIDAYARYVDAIGDGAWDLVLNCTAEEGEAAGGLLSWSKQRLKSRLNRLRWVGRLDAEAYRSMLAGASTLVFPSLYEGYGMPVREAMSLGVPLVVSERGALPEVAAGAGQLLDPEDPIAWSETFLRLTRDDSYRLQLAESSHRAGLAAQQLDSRETLAQLLESASKATRR